MNPDTNKLEPLTTATPEMAKQLETLEKQIKGELVRPNGEPVPKHWTVLKQGESVVIKDYTFKIAYMNEGCVLLEPVGPYIVGAK